LDVLSLAGKGDEFEVVVPLDVEFYGVDSVAVRMKKNELTELTECIESGCRNRAWCKCSLSNPMFFALKHVTSYHLPEKINKGGTVRHAEPSFGMASFFSPVPAPQKTDKHSSMRVRGSICDLTVEPQSPADDDGTPAADALAQTAAAAAVPGPAFSPLVGAPITAPSADPDSVSDAACPGGLTATQTEFVRCPGIVLAVPSPGNENYPFGVHTVLRQLPYTVSLSQLSDIVIHGIECARARLILLSRRPTLVNRYGKCISRICG
jgi:hypothetical protein